MEYLSKFPERSESMKCKKCHSTNVDVIVGNVYKRGCLMTTIDLLLTLCTGGLWLIFRLILGKKPNTKSIAVCQNCGNKWVV